MDGLPPSKRRRTDSSIVVFPSYYADVQRDAGRLFRFAAIVDVARLSPHWGYGIAANRPLEDSRVEDLLQSFRKHVRRLDHKTRLRVAMPRQIIHEILQNTFNRKERERARSYGTTDCDDYPILDLSARAFHKAYFRLEDGQHRRAALMRLCGLRSSDTRGIFLRDSFQIRVRMSTMWAIEVFEMEALDEQPLAGYLLRNEKSYFQRTSTHGYMFCVFHALWSGLTQEQRHAAKRSQAEFAKFMNTTLGVTNPNDYSGLYSILKDDEWYKQCLRLVATPWGRQKMVLGDLAIASEVHLPHRFLHHVTRVCDWFEIMIGSVADRIDPADMEVLIKESQGLTSSRLRPLFFPVLDDFILDHENHLVTGNVSHLDIDWMLKHPGKQPAWPTMRDAFAGVSGHFYRYRRPQFLSVLSDQEYQTLYTRLLRSRATFPVPQWEAITDDARKVGMLTHWILYHMIQWFNPDFNILDRDTDSGCTWSWDEVVREYVISRRRGTVRKPHQMPLRESLQSSAAALVDDVTEICRTYRDKLNLSELKHLLENSASESEHDGNQRFAEDPWNKLLMIAWDYTGGEFPSTGHLAQYRDRHKINERFFSAKCIGSLERLVAVNNSELQYIFRLFNSTVPEELEQNAKYVGALYMYEILKKLHTSIETYRVNSDRGVVVKRLLEKYKEMINTLVPNAAAPLEQDGLLPQIQPPQRSLPASEGNVPLSTSNSSHSKSSQKSVSESSEKPRPGSSASF